MIQSMKEQEMDMKSAFKSELTEIENGFLQVGNDICISGCQRLWSQERSELLAANAQLLEEICEKRNKLEQEYMDKFLETAERYEEMLKEIRMSDNEEYNALKVKLETDVQTLEQHLETMRATYQLNAEKLEYNYRVLVERDFENSSTINQQKRKAGGLSEIF